MDRRTPISVVLLMGKRAYIDILDDDVEALLDILWITHPDAWFMVVLDKTTRLDVPLPVTGAAWTMKEMSDACDEMEYILKRVRNELIWEEGKMFVQISDYLADRHRG